jgi:predicted PurR-regulated permease PerM
VCSSDLNLRAVLAVGVLLVVLASVLFLLGWTLYSPLQGYVKQWPSLQKQMDEFLQQYSGRLGLSQSPTLLELFEQAARLLTGQSGGELVKHLVGAVFTIILGALVVIVGAMYLIAEPRMMRPALKLLPPERQGRTYRMIYRLQPQLRWWVIGQTAGMIMVGIASAIGYLIVGLPFALPVAIFAGLAEIVPTFGPMITLIVAALVAATAGLGKVVGAVIVYTIVQTTESYLLVPVLMRRTVNVPPIVTLLTVVLWGNVFGPIGLVLAVPIDLVIWAMLREFVIRPHEEMKSEIRNPKPETNSNTG